MISTCVTKFYSIFRGFFFFTQSYSYPNISEIKRYIEEFRLFTRLWKTVLAEKKELNAKVNAFKKAQKNLEQARKKYAVAETKQVRPQILCSIIF